MTCNLCGSDRFKMLFPGNMPALWPERFSQYAYYNDILKCMACGLVQEVPLLEREEVISLLSSETYLDEPIGLLNAQEKGVEFRALLRIMQQYCVLREAHLLDVGTNTGGFLRECVTISSKLAGIEPSREAAAVCQANGFVVHNCIMSAANIDDSSLDVVTMWDVIEHLYDPLGDMRFIWTKTRPGGRIFVSTHDIDCVFARITGRRCPMLMYQHLFHFSRRTLSALLQVAGWRVLGVKSLYKSWSLAYLHHLLMKLWPENALAKTLHRATRSLAHWPATGSIRLRAPLRAFFVVAAEKPA